jgi:LAS superfamily LD-carboxypeptidase LdcB
MLIKNTIFLLFLAGGNMDTTSYFERGYCQGKPFYFSAIELPMREVATGEKVILEKAAADRFKDMVSDAAKEGYYIGINHSYRTHSQQRVLKRRKGKLAAKAGWSTHQMGRSVDLTGTRRKIEGKHYRTILYWWLKRNAPKYGFYNDVSDEPWHWTHYEDKKKIASIRSKR